MSNNKKGIFVALGIVLVVGIGLSTFLVLNQKKTVPVSVQPESTSIAETESSLETETKSVTIEPETILESASESETVTEQETVVESEETSAPEVISTPASAPMPIPEPNTTPADNTTSQSQDGTDNTAIPPQPPVNTGSSTDQTNTGTATQTPPVNTTPPVNNNTGADGFTRDESGAIVTDGSCPIKITGHVEEKHTDGSSLGLH